MISRRLLATVAAIALASAQIAPAHALLPYPDVATAPAGTSSTKEANTSFVSTAITNLKTYLLGFLQSNYTLQVSSAAAMRSLVGFSGVTVHRSGFYAAGDGGAGDYAFSSAACSTDDGGSCLNAPSGSWRLDWDTMPVATSLLFGAKCDGATNDGTMIQAAVNAGASLGVEIIIAPQGRTCIVDSIGLRTNSHVRIDGTLKAAGNKQNLLTNYSFVYQTGGASETNVIVDAGPAGTLDNAMPGGPNIPAAASVACLSAYGPVQYWTINDLTMQNCGAWPYNFQGNTSTPRAGAAHIVLNRVKTLNSSNSSQFAEGCDDCWSHNQVSRGSGDYPIAFYGNITRSGADYFDLDGGGGGVAVLMDGARGSALTSYPSSDITIGPGNINNQASSAVLILDNTTGTSAHTLHANIKILPITGANNDYAGGAYAGGISAYYVNGLQIMGGYFYGDGGNHSGSTAAICGVYLDATVSNAQVMAPNIGNEAPTGGNGYGICSTGATYVSIIAPHVHDEQATPTTLSAFYGTFGVGTNVYGGYYAGLKSGVGLPGSSIVTASLGAASNVLGVPGVNSGLSNNLSAPNLIASNPNGQVQIGSTAGANNPALLANSSGSTTQDFTMQFSGGTAGTANKGTLALNGGNLLINAPLSTNGAQAVSCSGQPSGSYAVTNGIVTHC